MEGGTLERQSRRRSSGREEMVGGWWENAVEVMVVEGRWRWGWWWWWWWCCGFGKQDLVSHEKWRELQFSDDIKLKERTNECQV